MTATQIRYLMAIDKLSSIGAVRSADIAENLDVTRPSAHRMITQLSGMGLLEKEKYSSVRITEHGRFLAKRYSVCFSCICGLLNRALNISHPSAESGALTILSSLDSSGLESAYLQMKAKEIRMNAVDLMPGNEIGALI